MQPSLLLILLLVSAPPPGTNPAPRLAALPPQETDVAPFNCRQPAAEQQALIREAEANSYSVRRVEFLGNEHIRDHLLRRHVTMQEGDLFTRRSLAQSLRNLSRLKRLIHPVRLSDVWLRLEKDGKMVDMTICFREKRSARGD